MKQERDGLAPATQGTFPETSFPPCDGQLVQCAMRREGGQFGFELCLSLDLFLFHLNGSSSLSFYRSSPFFFASNIRVKQYHTHLCCSID